MSDCPQKSEWAIFLTREDAQAYIDRWAKPFDIICIIEPCGDHFHVKPLNKGEVLPESTKDIDDNPRIVVFNEKNADGTRDIVIRMPLEAGKEMVDVMRRTDTTNPVVAERLSMAVGYAELDRDFWSQIKKGEGRE